MSSSGLIAWSCLFGCLVLAGAFKAKGLSSSRLLLWFAILLCVSLLPWIAWTFFLSARQPGD
jgi:hypothetical protein